MAPRPTPGQSARRRDKVREWTLAGYTVGQMATALNVGPAVVIADRSYLRQRGKLPDMRLVGGSRKDTAGQPGPPPYDWQAAPPSPLASMPAWQRTSPVRLAATLLANLLESNARNRLAHNVREATAAADYPWLTTARKTVADLRDYLEEMGDILDDAEALETAINGTGGRDDLSGRYMITPAGAGRPGTPMPPPGGGEMPGQVYAEIWRRRYAGLPVDAEAIARSLKTKPARVREALASYEQQAAAPVTA